MKKLVVILLTAALLPSAVLAVNLDWLPNNGSSVFDLPANWLTGVLPSGGTDEARIEGNLTTTLNPVWPVITSSINTNWGLGRLRAPGVHLTQTGGTFEWANGSGVPSKGLSIFSRPEAYPNNTTTGRLNDPAHPCILRMTGGTMITDQVGMGTTGSINSGSYFSLGGDYAEDTDAYKNWVATAGDNRYGWGRLEIRGNATFIVRPNRVAFPTGYVETNAFWVYDVTNTPTADYPSRVYDILISTNSQLVISDNGKLIAPLPIYLADKDLVTQLKYYAGLIQAGASPHYVSNGALSGARLVAGPGQTLQFDSFPGTNDLNEPYGGYFTVTAVPAPFVQLNVLSAGSLGVGGLVGRVYQIESTENLNSPASWAVRTNFTLTVSPQIWNDPTPSSTNRFYRAALLPLP